MAAALVYFPGAMPSFNRNGGATTAKLYFYLNGTTTPATVYTSSSLATPLPFPVVSDSSGQFPSIWADSASLFTAVWVTDDDQTHTINGLAPSTAVITGPAGPPTPITFNAPTTIAAGGMPTVTNTGTSLAPALTFGLVTGLTGAAGTLTIGSTTTGAAGTSASVTNTGSPSAAVFSFTIPKGDPGAAATIAVGTVTTGAPGTSVTITNSGSSAAAVFNFTIPQGATGAAGTGSGNVNSTGTITNGSGVVYADGTGNLIKSDVAATGTGAPVRATSPTLITPALGVATATSLNGLTVSTSTGTLTVTNAKTLTVSNSLTLAGTDGSTLSVGAGGTLAALAFKTTASLTADVSGTLPVANGGTGAVTLTAYGVLVGNGTGAVTATSVGTATQVLTSNGPGLAPTFQAAAGGSSPVSWFRQERASGTGPLETNIPTTAWTVRQLNTTKVNGISATLSSNTITLPAGTYEISAFGTAASINQPSQISTRLYNVTDATVAIQGPSQRLAWDATDANSAGAVAPVSGQIVITGSKDFQLQQRATLGAVSGGEVFNQGVEVYADIYIKKTA